MAYKKASVVLLKSGLFALSQAWLLTLFGKHFANNHYWEVATLWAENLGVCYSLFYMVGLWGKAFLRNDIVSLVSQLGLSVLQIPFPGVDSVLLQEVADSIFQSWHT